MARAWKLPYQQSKQGGEAALAPLMAALDLVPASHSERLLGEILNEASTALHCNVALHQEGRLSGLDVASMLQARDIEPARSVQLRVLRYGDKWVASIRRDGWVEEVGAYASPKLAAAAIIHVQQRLLTPGAELPGFPLKQYP